MYPEQAQARDIRDLERLGMASERMTMVNERLLGFINRFRGLKEPSNGGPTAIREGYAGQIEDIHDKLNVLENIANEISTLG